MSLQALRARLEKRRAGLRAMPVAVVAGGGSSEREVSLVSGSAVADALAHAGYSAHLLPVSLDDVSIDCALAGGGAERALPPGAEKAAAEPQPAGGEMALWDPGALVSRLRDSGVVFTTMHGSRGENGAWQGLLELIGVPYVSAGVKGSALGMDKLISKYVFERLGVPTPRFWVARGGTRVRQDVPPEIAELVAKPTDQGSSVGIEMVSNDEAGWRRVEELLLQYDPLLIEERIHGRELTAAVIGHSTEPMALPLVEIKPKRGFYDYQAKYTAGQSEYVCPADVPESLVVRVQGHAKTVYREFDLEPYARIDLLLDEQGAPWFLEANTLPGFTPLSLLPRAARAAGIEFGELLELLMLCAVERAEHRRRPPQ